MEEVTILEAARSAEEQQPTGLELKEPIWEQQEWENELWWPRFVHYRSLGPTRSVSLASTGERNHYPVPAHWAIVAKKHKWKVRAQAYDATQPQPPSEDDEEE